MYLLSNGQYSIYNIVREFSMCSYSYLSLFVR